jgi:hypothetical protein
MTSDKRPPQSDLQAQEVWKKLPKPLRLICQGMLAHEYTYAYGALDVCTGKLDSLILPHLNTECMQLFLNEATARKTCDRACAS